MVNYNGWGYRNDYNGSPFCGSCEGGRIGNGMTTYQNNRLLGTASRPVVFTELRRMYVDGKEIDVLVADHPFFDRLRFDCTLCRDFYASICTCIEFGDVRPVFISEGDCQRLLPLETSVNGFMIHADQIQPFSNSMKPLRMTACFDPGNDHVTVSTYYKRHLKCGCHEEQDHNSHN